MILQPLRLGLDDTGQPTPEWKHAVEAHGAGAVAWAARPLTAQECDWVRLLRSRLSFWEGDLPRIP